MITTNTLLPRMRAGIGAVAVLAGCDPGTVGSTPAGTPPIGKVVAGTHWTGEPADELGASLSVGDADGDGDDEVLVSRLQLQPVPPYSRSLVTHGALLIDGEAPSGAARAVASAEWSHVSTGYGALDAFGSAAFLPGDLTGDGLPDVALVPGAAEGEALRLYPGDVSGVVPDDAATVTLAHDLYPPPPNELRWDFTPMVPCGDVGGDGSPDLCAGNWVFHGPLAGDLGPADADVTIGVWPAVNDVVALDHDGNGVNELAFSWWQPGTTEIPSSVSWLSDLSPGAHDFGAVTWRTDSQAWLAAGDLDGDGADDLVIGIPYDSDLAVSAIAYVFTELLGGALEDAAFQFPVLQATIGDFDGDGAADLAGPLAVSDLSVAERVGVFLGPFSPGAYTEADAAVIWRMSAAPPAVYKPLTVDSGDLDGDGRADLVLGHPSDETAGPDAGEVVVLLGAGL